MTCPECGQPDGECYRICPLQDPYGGDQAAENADYEFNARYDSVSERYMEHCPKHGPYAGDCGGCEAEHYEAMDGNDDDYSEVVTSTGVLVYSVDDFTAPLLPTDTDDIPF